MGSHPLSFARLDFATTPFLVIWETTQACPLACQHCRAEAEERRDPRELSTEEGKRLLEQIRDMGTPVCVLSGGDPLRRPDLLELIRHGAGLGLRMATIPAASNDLTRDRLAALRDAGLAQVAFSLDGSTAELHDGFRKVPGTYAKTMQAVAWAHELELPLQINTTFARFNRDDLDNLIALVSRLGIVFWEVFSLVAVGRGTVLQPMDASEHEDFFSKLYNLSKHHPFIIKLTEAPHYRRYVLQHGGNPLDAPQSNGGYGRRLHRAPLGVTDGKGVMFVSHRGEICPAGFLPLVCGRFPQDSVVDVYQHHPTFRALRDPDCFGGLCGVCEYRYVCGGSRARAYAVTGDPLAAEPDCVYIPKDAPSTE